MHKKFDIVERAVMLSDKEDNLIDIYTNPDEKEKQEILKNLLFDEHTLLSALDADEIPRVEFEEDYTFVVWKRPKDYSVKEELRFGVSSIGMILSDKKLIVILDDEYDLFNRREFCNVTSLYDIFLKILFYTIRRYVERIKEINLLTKDIASKLNISLDNKYLIRMFNLSENLVYYIDAISANNTVLRKLKNNIQKLNLTLEQSDALEDLIIENSQCLKQSEIYSIILSGLMDARGNVINNNMNILIRRLTLINCIFLPLGLIAGMGGMSEFTMMLGDYGIDWRIGYPLFALALVPIGLLAYKLLRNMAINGNR